MLMLFLPKKFIKKIISAIFFASMFPNKIWYYGEYFQDYSTDENSCAIVEAKKCCLSSNQRSIIGPEKNQQS